MADDAQPPPQAPEAASGAPEPSMEEILASIRKIISDDDPGKAKGDVIELTQVVQDDGSVVDTKATTPPPAAAPAPAAAPEPPKAAAPPPPPAETLVSDKAATSAASSLSTLANTVEIERLASAPAMTATFIGNNARTLEEMTIQLMKPMLQEWLEKNLPSVVDRLVQKEIERISKKIGE